MTAVTFSGIKRQISDKQDWQDSLRRQIDRMPDGHEREAKIDLLFVLHKEIDELHDLLYRD